MDRGLMVCLRLLAVGIYNKIRYSPSGEVYGFAGASAAIMLVQGEWRFLAVMLIVLFELFPHRRLYVLLDSIALLCGIRLFVCGAGFIRSIGKAVFNNAGIIYQSYVAMLYRSSVQVSSSNAGLHIALKLQA